MTRATTAQQFLLLSILPVLVRPGGAGSQQAGFIPAACQRLHALASHGRQPPVAAGGHRPLSLGRRLVGRLPAAHPLQMSGKGFGKAASAGEGGDRAASSGGDGGRGGMEAIMYLPLEYVKIAPLRMFLGFWVMGRKDWKGGQGDDGSLMCAKADGSGGALIEFRDEEMEGGPSIVVWRVDGDSLGYRLQEAMLLHSLLDELQSLIKDDAVEEGKKLFKLKKEGGIEFARSGLPAKPM